MLNKIIICDIAWLVGGLLFPTTKKYFNHLCDVEVLNKLFFLHFSWLFRLCNVSLDNELRMLPLLTPVSGTSNDILITVWPLRLS